MSPPDIGREDRNFLQVMEWVHGQTGSTPLPRPHSKRLGIGGSGLEKGTLGVVLKKELAQLA